MRMTSQQYLIIMNSKIIRQEYKYFINNEEILYLRSTLSKLMCLDPNSDIKTNKYTVTSLYFDTPLKDDLTEKQSGIYYREKFRIRTYNSQKLAIKFESKQRADTAINKTSHNLSYDDALRIINGNYEYFLQSNNQFLQETYLKFITKGYKPSVIVEYDREAYYLPFGNIRITFDIDLRTFNANHNIFELNNADIPIFLDGLQILEIKYSSKLPIYLKKILSRIRGNRCAISKFVYGQKYIDASPWGDKIFSPS